MPRLIILIIPLAILCVVMVSGPVTEIRDELGARGDVRSHTVEGFRNEEKFETSPEERRKGLGYEVSAVPLLEDGDDELTRLERTSNLKPEEKVALVWEVIRDKIPVEFSPNEVRELKSYLEDSVGKEVSERTWLCWAPGTSREKALLYQEVESVLGLNPNRVGLFANQFLGTARWGSVASHAGSTSEQGRPAVLTWSIVPDGTMAPGKSGQSAAASDFQEFFNGIYGNSPGEPIESQPWFPILESAFEAMGETCGVKFVFEPNDDGIAISTFVDGILGTRGDIRLAARALDGPSDTLAFAYSPGYGDMVFDSSDTFFNSTGASSIRLHNVVAHELGHALGLAHVCPINGTKLMEPLISLGFRGPRFDEYQSLQRQYGDALEHHSAERDNDNQVDATPLTLLIDDSLSYSRLSIDDNSDVDYFRLPALAGQKITVEIEPAQGTYLEGEQVGENCSEGELFNPGSIHDLTLEVIAPTGGTVLVSSDSGGLGEGELIADFEFPDDGNYYLRVNGGGANATQIYALDIFTEDHPPRPEIVLIGSEIVGESGKVKNFRPDPDETLKVQVELKNVGNLATENLQVSLSGPPNLVPFENEVLMPVMNSNDSGLVELIFGLRGACGSEIPLTLTVSDSAMEPVSFELNYQLGEVIGEVLMDEDFDASTTIPTAWSPSSTGGGFDWVVLPSVNVSSSPNAMFCQGVGEVGQSLLMSPEVTLGGEGGRLIFQHWYDTESTWDGCVLEASRNGGSWFDLLDSGAVVVSGGYNNAIRSSSTSGLARRDAWTGSSGGFLTTEIEFPSSWAGDEVKFRWIIACDRSQASAGWYLDDVQILTSTALCEDHEPELALTAGSTEVEEGDRLEVTVSSILPLVLSEAVSFSVSGDATLSDLDGGLSGNISAGDSMVTLSVLAVEDGLAEGDEALILSLNGEGLSKAFTIQDPSGYGLWALGFSLPSDQPGIDSDGDGFSELAEYLLDTDPTDISSVPDLSIEMAGGMILFPLGELPIRADATLAAERSLDMVNWTSTSLVRTALGLEISGLGAKSFVRLVFSLNE
ncbi:matrixin family metalloprotease [Akkermansiaceae bacterium]|nr:matrixin family metalloprotease [Akkermansiaceae bacterium]MDB4544326.1 matrixin family metalloprotease [Akkermansiaceae bacterium]